MQYASLNLRVPNEIWENKILVNQPDDIQVISLGGRKWHRLLGMRIEQKHIAFILRSD